jgi:MHS family alpha-ketoglutarate permease-like MFS transporter
MSTFEQDIASASRQKASPTQVGLLNRIVVACSGNIVEWYDFFAYAYTAIYFAGLFFPSGDRNSQLLATAGVFAVGFMVRPIGGWLFGRLADRRGRKAAMMVSVSMMGLGSLCIAILPVYGTIGALAPVLLVVARLVQGMSVGGEYSASAIYMSEIAPPGRTGLYSSIQYATIVLGQLLSLLTIVTLQHCLSTEDMRLWGWRIPFAIGAATSLIVIALRRNMVETLPADIGKREDAGSIAHLLGYKHGALLVILFTAGGSLFFYTFGTYMQKFLIGTVHLSPSVASLIMSVALMVFMLEQPLCGLFGDRIGTKWMMIIFSGAATLTAAPIMLFMSSVSNPIIAFALVVAGLTITCFYTSISGILKADLFPTEIRGLGVGLPHAIGNSLFGGSAEYVALTFKSWGHESYFFGYITLMALITLLATLTMPNPRKFGHLSSVVGDHERRT